MKSHSILSTVVLVVGVAVAPAVAQTDRPVEVIDLESPQYDTSQPVPSAGDLEQLARESEPLPPPATPQERQEKYERMRESQQRRIDAIKSFFEKLKTDVDEPAGSAASAPLEDVPPLMELGTSGPERQPRGEDGYDEGADQIEESASGRFYAVAKGDTLSSIARRFLGSSARYPLIAEANGLTPRDVLKIGQKLLIPDATGSRPARSAARVESSPAPRAAASSPPARSAPAPAAASSAPGGEPKLDYASYEFKLYEVAPGDTLASVAQRFYQGKGDPSLIQLYNNQKEKLTPGEKILIPLPKSDASSRADGTF